MHLGQRHTGEAPPTRSLAGNVLRGSLGFLLGGDEFIAGPNSGVLARHGNPHTYWNAGDTDAEYLLVMTPRIAMLIEAIHRSGADIPALFRAHESEIISR